ncbi:uroporphyrinogen-III C-methyltransferase [Paludibacterium paludis]|uniref:Heme biosynthesis operon protein HemX n=1 Tax=Paludibacterium paludis TaxID=1225769 RepID=A0A918U8V5_9NEIS|nr:uroporphyrinogen-III C-methyltransferase [Paludibacterium paludis]GGY09005.1 heme biosynthesis operon protein HemX [Paludibacterium paludis]
MSEFQIVDPVKPARSKLALLALAVSLTALGASLWQLYVTRADLDAVRGEAQRHAAQAGASTEANRRLSDETKASARLLEARLAALEARQGDVTNQIGSLNSLYQDLTSNRSDWLLSEAEYTLTIASQQLQLAGNVPLAINALERLNARLAKTDRPQLITVRKKVARDLAQLKGLPVVDTVGLSVKLDALASQVDQLPLSVDQRQAAQESARKHAAAAGRPAWERLLDDMVASLGELVRIRRMDKPDAVLLSPEQTRNLRENLKLRLLDARLALLQRDGSSFNADVGAAARYVNQYFDTQAPLTRQWLATLGEAKDVPLSLALPDLADSLKAVRDAQGLQGS